MAVVGPALPALGIIGGGSQVVGAALVAATVGAGIVSIQQTRAAGKIAEAQADINSKAEGDKARDREIDRRKQLLRAISSQVASAGASGVAFDEGSPEQIARLDIEEARDDSLIDTANTKQRQRGLKLQGRAARVQANTRAFASLIDTAKDTAGLLI